jgi:uncharacterized membrane protein YbhN (UPF0104 family)
LGRKWRWAIQTAVAVIVTVFVVYKVAENWDRFRSLHLTLDLRPGWLLLSFACLAVVAVLQIESWRRILAGWGQSLPFARGARIWFLANLGRYVPGKVWSVAGMVVLAREDGVQPWAAAASAVAVQALGLGTAAAVVAATVPGATSGLRMAVAAAASVATIGVLAWEGGLRRLARLAGSATEWTALPLRTVLVSAVLTAASWVVYGVAFWLLGLGLGLPGTLPVGTAIGVFALGYVLGLLALFAPGGIGVREALFFTLLTPFVGAGGAVALSVASRLQLTLTEAAAGLGALFIGKHKEKDARDAIGR